MNRNNSECPPNKFPEIEMKTIFTECISNKGGQNAMHCVVNMLRSFTKLNSLATLNLLILKNFYYLSATCINLQSMIQIN